MSGPAAPGILEWVSRMYEDLLRTELPAALQSVQDTWAADGYPLDLPPIAQWHRGNIPDTALFAVLLTAPAITIEAISLQPTGETLIALVDSVVISVYTYGRSVDEAETLTQRYAQAIAAVVLTNTPRGKVGIHEVLPITVGVGETLDAARGAFLKRAAIRVPLRVGARL
jgi:hypothetical protein